MNKLKKILTILLIILSIFPFVAIPVYFVYFMLKYNNGMYDALTGAILISFGIISPVCYVILLFFLLPSYIYVLITSNCYEKSKSIKVSVIFAIIIIFICSMRLYYHIHGINSIQLSDTGISYLVSIIFDILFFTINTIILIRYRLKFLKTNY